MKPPANAYEITDRQQFLANVSKSCRHKYVMLLKNVFSMSAKWPTCQQFRVTANTSGIKQP
jgi:hypothetical protein